MNLVENTFNLFHEWAGQNKIIYAVLRNYDALPDVGNDLDLAMRQGDVEKFRAAVKQGLFGEWDYITEVTTHNSSIERLNIYIFRFYSLSQKSFVQFDFFQGFSIMGQEFFNVADLLLDVRTANKYSIVSKNVENLIKYLQVLNAIKNKQPSRINKYATQLINDGQCVPIKRLSLTDAYLKELLIRKDYPQYLLILDKARKKFVLNTILKSPLNFLEGVIGKLKYNFSLYVSDPFAAYATVSKNTDKKMLTRILEDMMEEKVIRHYLFYSAKGFFSIRYLKMWLSIRSHGGLIITMADNGLNVLDGNSLKDFLYLSLTKKEKTIYKK